MKNGFNGVLLLTLASFAAVLPAEEIAGKAPVNLLANSEFARAGRDASQPAWWTLAGTARAVRREDPEGSGRWILVVEPGAYPVMSQRVLLTAGRTYTVKVTARCPAGDVLLGVCQSGPEGRIRHILWREPLTREFRTFRQTFTAAFGMDGVTLYSIAPSGSVRSGALEIAGVYLYEGASAP